MAFSPVATRLHWDHTDWRMWWKQLVHIFHELMASWRYLLSSKLTHSDCTMHSTFPTYVLKLFRTNRNMSDFKTALQVFSVLLWSSEIYSYFIVVVQWYYFCITGWSDLCDKQREPAGRPGSHHLRWSTWAVGGSATPKTSSPSISTCPSWICPTDLLW